MGNTDKIRPRDETAARLIALDPAGFAALDMQQLAWLHDHADMPRELQASRISTPSKGCSSPAGISRQAELVRRSARRWRADRPR
jgi:hypothetical protein